MEQNRIQYRSTEPDQLICALNACKKKLLHDARIGELECCKRFLYIVDIWNVRFINSRA